MKSNNQPDKKLAAKAIRNRTAPAISSAKAAPPAAAPRSEQHLDAEVLAAFLEGQLPTADRNQALAHLAICSRCRQIVALSSVAAHAESPALAVSPVPSQGELTTELPEEAIPTPPSRWKLLNFPVLAAVACAALVVLSLWLIPAFHRKTTPVSLQRPKQSVDQHGDTLASTTLSSQSSIRSGVGSGTDSKLKSQAQPVSQPKRPRYRHSRPAASQPPGSGSTAISSESLEASLKPQSQRSARPAYSRGRAARVSPRSLAAPRLSPPRLDSEAPSPGPAAAQMATSIPPAPISSRGTAERSIVLSNNVRQELRKAPAPSVSQPVDVDSFMQALVAPVPLPDASVLDSSPLTRPSRTALAPKTAGATIALAAPVAPPLPSQLVTSADLSVTPSKSLAKESPAPGPTGNLNANPGPGSTPASRSSDSLSNAAAAARDLEARALERPLPNGANPLAAAAVGPLLLAIDSSGYLERSDDSGKSWQPIDPQWTGRLISLRVALTEAASSGGNTTEPKSEFEIETVDRKLYRSSDGMNWHLVKQ